jgi:tetratricopeptide (TPR) repeat protein
MRRLRHAIAFACALALVPLLAALPAQAGPREDCGRLKNLDLGIRACDSAIRLNPRDAISYSNRGMFFIGKGEYDRAIADFNEALKLSPRDARYYNNRGIAYISKGEYDRAIADESEAIRLDARLANAFNNRGAAYTRKGDYDKAIADLNEAIRLAPGYGSAYRNRGNAYTRKGDLDRALVDLNKAIRLEPDSAIAYVRRGQTWEAKGERLKAIEDYVKALALPAPTQQVRDEQADARRRLAALQAVVSAPPTKVELTPPKVAPIPVLPPPPLAPLGRRVALAIGNGTYRKVDPLPNPKKDAADIGAALKSTGFTEVVVYHDLGLKEMQRALAAFEERAADAEWAVVYYGGHAIQVDGKNYLVPVDAELKSPSDVEDETVVLDRLLARIAGAGKLRLVILDACRTNPFRRTWGGTKFRDVAERGLVRYETKQRNVVIAYAAAEGEAAIDGPPGENSPYVKALLKHLATPGLEIGKLFRLVGDDVIKETGGKQQPFEYGSRSGEDLFFRVTTP